MDATPCQVEIHHHHHHTTTTSKQRTLNSNKGTSKQTCLMFDLGYNIDTNNNSSRCRRSRRWMVGSLFAPLIASAVCWPNNFILVDSIELFNLPLPFSSFTRLFSDMNCPLTIATIECRCRNIVTLRQYSFPIGRLVKDTRAHAHPIRSITSETKTLTILHRMQPSRVLNSTIG